MAKIAFFGTPDFAVPALMKTHQFCLENSHELAMVITQPDKSQGRGQKLLAPAVKLAAESINAKVFQPSTLKKNTTDGDEFFKIFHETKIDLALVVAYGKILPTRLLSSANVGFVNIHGSLLPKFRGAAPVQRAIEAGLTETGLCLMDVVPKLDEGDIYASIKTPILASDTSKTLFRRMSRLGAHLLYKNLDNLLLGKLKKVAQACEGISYAHMLDKNEGKINLEDDGKTIVLKARAFDPWPHLYGLINQKRVKFFDGFYIKTKALSNHKPGTIITTNPFLGIKTHDGAIYFQAMQVEGKKILPIAEAIKGFSLTINHSIVQ